MKALAELWYWYKRYAVESGKFRNSHYKKLYESFDIDYSGKSILDFGSGPRGSLDWHLDGVCYDPLGFWYNLLFKSDVTTKIPNRMFDVVSCFNALDHVDDLWEAVELIDSHLKPGGDLIIIAEIEHAPTVAEPVILPRDLSVLFGYKIVSQKWYEKVDKNIHNSVLSGYESSEGTIEKVHLKKWSRNS